ncbi:hypothetical protein [Nocardioides sp.]|uniref:hypothetical protein n=1 Tax=Nocardioides sp. TaxID=35761 RepID=UPI0035693D8D
MTMVTVTTEHTNPRSCVCNDHQVDELRDLITQGFTQRDASHVLWGDPTRAPWELQRRALRAQVTTMATARTRARFPWLRLPERNH